MMEEQTKAKGERFEPTKYLVNLNGKGEYLEVKFRLVWLRTEYPEALIETELVRLEERDAIFKARITLPNGAVATGWGSESAGDFRDFIEKAETKAIGRACAALGYGTQFCHDHEFGVGETPQVNVGTMRIVDAPVDLSSPRGRASRSGPPGNMGQRNGNGNGGAGDADPANQKATERQVKFIYAIGREGGLDEQELATWSQELFGQEIAQLSRRDASSLIEALQRRRNEVV